MLKTSYPRLPDIGFPGYLAVDLNRLFFVMNVFRNVNTATGKDTQPGVTIPNDPLFKGFTFYIQAVNVFGAVDPDLYGYTGLCTVQVK